MRMYPKTCLKAGREELACRYPMCLNELLPHAERMVIPEVRARKVQEEGLDRMDLKSQYNVY